MMNRDWFRGCLGVTGALFLGASVAGAPQRPTLQQLSERHPSQQQDIPQPHLLPRIPAAHLPGRMTDLAERSLTAAELQIKAAGIEVAWLRNPATYPYRLRAEPTLSGDAVALQGFLPSETLRQKALQLAQAASGGMPVQDHLVVQHNMELAAVVPADKQLARQMQDHVQKCVESVAVQIDVDARGVATVSGRVDDLSDRRKIIRAVQAFPGCTAIRYDLRVGMPQPLSPLVTTASAREPLEQRNAVSPSAPALRGPIPVASSSGTSAPATGTAPQSSRPAPSPVNAAHTQPAKGAVVTGKSEPGRPQFVKIGDARQAQEPVKIKETLPASTDTSLMTVSSVSGLTPPMPSVSLGQPLVTRPQQNSFLIGLPILPKTPERSEPLPSRPPALTQSVIQAKAVQTVEVETLPLPVIRFEPVKDMSSPTVIEAIGVKPK